MSTIRKISLALVAAVILVSVTILYTFRDNLNISGDPSDDIGSALFIAKVKAGAAVKFGTYEQDNNTENGSEAIVWRVLAAEKGKALLIAEKILDSKAYDEKEESDVTWEYSTIRDWLNDDFLSRAFSAQERRTIILTETDNSRYDSPRGYYSPAGDNTQDKVFLLSLQEVEKYYKDDPSRQVPGTEFAKNNGLDVAPVKDKSKGNSYWWLRSPGYYPNCAGSIDFYGHTGDYAVTGIHVGVRPAIWVNMKG